MSDSAESKVGTIGWRDLTVENAEAVRDFYQRVVGWESRPVSMGDYDDFSMVAPGSGDTVAGICHARGSNADIPPQWLVYIVVEDVERSAALTLDHGGDLVAGPRALAGGRFCVIRDPAGAVCALFQPPAEGKPEGGTTT
jgi:predicted enzyme related to lactoylglutathione lyase